jgi:hypothetical protein
MELASWWFVWARRAKLLPSYCPLDPAGTGVIDARQSVASVV